MGNIMALVNLDKRFRESPYSIVVNEYEEENKGKHLTVLEKLMLTEIEATLSFTPRCICGETVGGYKLGRKCTLCGGEVKRTSNSDLEPNTWFKTKVKGVKFISPAVLAYVDSKIMGNRSDEDSDKKEEIPCNSKKFSVLAYISNSKARLNKEMSNVDRAILDRLKNVKGFERNFEYFSKNFIRICKIIAEIKGGNTGREVIEFLNSLDSRSIHSNYIPVLNGKLVYKTGGIGGKVTPTYNPIRNLLLGYIDDADTEDGLLNQMAIVNHKSSCLYTAHVKGLISSKLGVGRKMGMSSKLDFSSRNVCIPSNFIKDVREVHMPYRNSIVMFRLHIANVLIKTLPMRKVHKKIRDAKVKFDQDIYDIMCSFIDNSKLTVKGRPYQPWVTGRNPGLLSGSILRLKLTKIKNDINDDTMEVSTPLAKLPNYDYDGDMLYNFLPLSHYVFDLLEPLDPYTSVNSPKEAGKVYGKIGLGPIAPLNIANRLRRERREYDI